MGNNLQQLNKQLYIKIPLIGSWYRQNAATVLAQNGSSEAIHLLAAALPQSDDENVRRITLEALKNLAKQGNSEAHEALCQLVIMPDPLHHGDTGKKALEALQNLAAGGNLEAQEALCQLVIEHDLSHVREIVLAAHYAPRDPQQCALFYFLTEQWEEYAQVDVDQHFLSMAYSLTPPELRQRIAVCAQQAGRLEWIKAVVKGQPDKLIGELSDVEWETTLSILSGHRQWRELWHLVSIAPAMWSVRFLRRLKEAVWGPEKNNEQTIFRQLVGLAERCHQRGIPEGAVHCYMTLEGHRDYIEDMVISQDGRFLASGSVDGTVRIWRLPDGALLNTVGVRISGKCSLEFSPDGCLLLSAGEDRTVYVWSFSDGKLLQMLRGHDERIIVVAVSPDGHRLISMSWDKTQLWSLPDGILLNMEKANFPCIVLSSDWHFMVGGEMTGFGKFKEWKPDRAVLPFLKKQPMRRWSLVKDNIIQFDQINFIVIRGSGKDSVCIWWLPNHENTLKTLRGYADSVLESLDLVNEYFDCLATSPDGQILAGGEYSRYPTLSKWLRLWSLPDKEILQTLDGGASHLAFSPDGRILASVEGHTIRLWNVVLANLRRLRAAQLDPEDVKLIKDTLKKGDVTPAQHAWLEFLLALTRDTVTSL